MPTLAENPDKLALLVGCSRYENPDLMELWGPRNDVELLAEALHERLGFPRAGIERLCGGLDEPQSRPTRKNIERAFRELIDRAERGAQVIVFFTGHGTQIPVTVPAGKVGPADEPDGLNEAFLPEDVTLPDPEGTGNVILDDQFAVWLQALRKKGASVWGIFDCCHSGTMARGIKPGERKRGVSPEEWGMQRPTGTRSPAEPASPLDEVWAAESPGGALVMFYAAQPFETAPELPRPADAPRERENYYGLFSYTLSGALQGVSAHTTYRDLAGEIVRRYVAERGSAGPTPLFEGDLDRELIGGGFRPAEAPILLQRDNGQLRLNAGELRGVTRNAVLAVHPPAVQETAIQETAVRDTTSDDVLGYVRVDHLTPFAAQVLPCPAPGGDALEEAGDFPNGARCTVVARPLDDRRLRLAFAPGTPADARRRRLNEVLASLQADRAELFECFDNAAAADFWYEVADGRLRLRPACGLSNGKEPAGDPPFVQLLAEYDLGDTSDHALREQLEHDLRRIFRWRNTWRVVDRSAARCPANVADVRLKLFRLTEQDTLGEELVDGMMLRPGSRIAYQICNQSPWPVWVSMLVMRGNCGIQVRPFPLLRAGDRLGPQKASITGDSWGLEGLVLLVVPRDMSRAQPDFHFLAQPGLGKASATGQRARSPDAAFACQTPVEELLAMAVRTRGANDWKHSASMRPVIEAFTWFCLPPSDPARPGRAAVRRIGSRSGEGRIVTAACE